MPFTPLHFGPGLFLKALLPRWVSLTAFLATQVVIDVEVAVHMARDAWPYHAGMHTAGAATGVGLAVGLLVPLAARAFGVPRRAWPGMLASEATLAGGLTGGLLGGITHVLLDALLYGDLRPFAPLHDVNPLYGLVGDVALHVACIAAGAVAAFMLWARWRRGRPDV